MLAFNKLNLAGNRIKFIQESIAIIKYHSDLISKKKISLKSYQTGINKYDHFLYIDIEGTTAEIDIVYHR